MLKVVYLNDSHPSRSWNNGYYIVLNDGERILNLCRLTNGVPETDDNGDLVDSVCTGCFNLALEETNLFYDTKKS